MENDKDNGIVLMPYIIKNIRTDVNGEPVWYANEWKNLILKIKRFFCKSEDFEKYKTKKIDSSYYKTMDITYKWKKIDKIY